MSDKKFFLFTCVKDGRNYIDNLFKSLLSQSTFNFIHYIYEDGSSFPLDEMVEKYIENVKKLPHPYEVIYEKNDHNVGLNYATKHCIDKCSCDYFIWIDCDNWVDKDFFKYLGECVDKNPNCELIRTRLETFPATRNKQKRYNNWKKELEMFLRSKYYYSFFAVKYSFYKSINPECLFMKDKMFFNDDQVLLLLLLFEAHICYTKKAIGYFLQRKNQESGDMITIEKGEKSQLLLLNAVSNDKYVFLKNYYKFKKTTRIIESNIGSNTKEAWRLFSSLKKECKNSHFPYSLLNYKNTIYLRVRMLAHLFFGED